jgi:stage V sporulation protein AB
VTNLIVGLVSASSGIVIGNAFAAFITLLGIVPRLIQRSRTKEMITLYQVSLSLGMPVFSLLYFFNVTLKLNKYFSIIFGLIFGTFLGLFTSALAETLNVIPVLSGKLDLGDYLLYIVISIALGKVFGSLAFWLVLNI